MNNNNNQVGNQEVNSMMIIDGLKLDRVTDSMKKIQDFQAVIQSQLVDGHDFGAAFPGSNKPSLLKPGAEKILMLLGLTSEYEILEKIQDYEDGFFAYTIKCHLTRGGQTITEGLGHCNSKERKYDSDRQDKYMLGNTCLKMAKKRAQVDAALTVGSLSNMFTQDLEDMQQFNQSERMETMNQGDAEGLKINFGKHRGKTMGQILKEDRGYVEWLKDKGRQDDIRQAAAMALSPRKPKEKPEPKMTSNANTKKEKVNKDTGETQKEIPDEIYEGTPFEDDENIPF